MMRRLAIVALSVTAACTGDANGAPRQFDAATSMEYIQTQLDFGPRIPGSEGHRRTGDWIVEQMRARADTVHVQEWAHVTKDGDSLPMRNVLARFKPDAAQRILYLAHWDTRPISDAATNKAERALPVPGANDGASGVALLMGVADALQTIPPAVGVDLLFVDGEDFGDFSSDTDVLIGSKYFAQHLPSPDYRPLFGVVWDMIGDADLKIYQEGHSMRRAPEIVARVWRIAADLGYYNVFIPTGGQSVTDDHLPLLDAGLRVINVIDIDYPSHHTPQDTFDKVSQESMQIVGDVAMALIRGVR
ncbi:MAG TPA: M28 family peptidase [Gemmatimonadaceae bacterium]|nr:M28 family peptidase [Gemmatimonadaceae bacterium]